MRRSCRTSSRRSGRKNEITSSWQSAKQGVTRSSLPRRTASELGDKLSLVEGQKNQTAHELQNEGYNVKVQAQISNMQGGHSVEGRSRRSQAAQLEKERSARQQEKEEHKQKIQAM